MKLITAIAGAAGLHTVRSSVQFLGSNLAQYQDYGCYCYFDDKVANVTAVGEPVNEIDSECQTLYQCYHDVIQQRAAHNEECVPWTVGYFSSAIHYQNNPGSTLEACEFMNRNGGGIGLPDQGACAAHACACEMDFSLNMVSLVQAGNDDLGTYSHANGFDTSTQCIDDSTTISTPGMNDSTTATTPDMTGFVQQDGTIRLYGVDADQCLYRRGMKVFLGKCRAQHASQNWLWSYDSVTWRVMSLTAYGSEDLCMTRVPKNNRFVAGLAVCDEDDTAQEFYYDQGRIHNGNGDNLCLGVSAVGLNKEKAISGKLGVAVEISRCVHTVWG